VFFYPGNTPAAKSLRIPRRLEVLSEGGRRAARRLPDGALSHQVRREVQLPFTLLSDPDRRVMKSTARGARKNKKVIGVIRSTVDRPQQQIKKHWKRVRTAKHPAFVAAISDGRRGGRGSGVPVETFI
jgi:hypothetical protein